MNVVIVEDEVRIREGIVNLLKKIDPSCEIAGEAVNGLDGLNICKKIKPDIVITDIRMPHMDGIQMLTHLKQVGVSPQVILLTAYSEFEYARSAMKLGVTEYLLKPISVNDFTIALDNSKQKLQREKQIKPAQVGTMVQVFRDIIDGRIEISEETEEYLLHNYDIKLDQSFLLICSYLGSDFENKVEQAQKQLLHSFSRYKDSKLCIIDSAYKKSLILVVYQYRDAHDLERWIQYQILQHTGESMAIGLTEVKGIKEIKMGIDNLYPYMDWNISFEDNIIISYPKITNIQTTLCIYPSNIESKIRVAICTFDANNVAQCMKTFHEYFMDGKVYNPKEVKECYVRFLWNILKISKEVSSLDEQQIEQQKLLEQIIHAKTRKELIESSAIVINSLQFDVKDVETINITVKRAISMIHEFYKAGITLDAIAAKLKITSEYLGTQFHKEMGVTFSTYVKNLRINKAKELLCGTDLKLYEIAEQVGYSDSKYFSKVFKEATGQLPAEYRKTIK